MAIVGRSEAVADLGWVRFSGRLAWLAWLFIHLAYLISFQNRLLVLLQWAGNYLTRNRGARIITLAAAPGPKASGGRPADDVDAALAKNDRAAGVA
jgi:hypothetical protein